MYGQATNIFGVLCTLRTPLRFHCSAITTLDSMKWTKQVKVNLTPQCDGRPPCHQLAQT